MWIAGAALTAGSLAVAPAAIVVSTAALLTMLIPWPLWLAARLR